MIKIKKNTKKPLKAKVNSVKHTKKEKKKTVKKAVKKKKKVVKKTAKKTVKKKKVVKKAAKKSVKKKVVKNAAKKSVKNKKAVKKKTTKKRKVKKTRRKKILMEDIYAIINKAQFGKKKIIFLSTIADAPTIENNINDVELRYKKCEMKTQVEFTIFPNENKFEDKIDNMHFDIMDDEIPDIGQIFG